MTQAGPGPAFSTSHRLQRLLGYAFYAVVAARTLNNAAPLGSYFVMQAAVLLAFILFLYATQPALTRHASWYATAYTLFYALSALILGTLRPYFDMWAALFIPLSVQVIHFYRPKVAAAWLFVYAACVLIGLLITLGVTGFTAGLTTIAGGAWYVSFDVIYTQVESARRASQQLLVDLRVAHTRLLEYSAQVEELAALRERNRLARELHDTVNQEIFSVTLNAQTANLLLEKDPERVPAQLDHLLALTNNTLTELRSLITQLRPPQAG